MKDSTSVQSTADIYSFLKQLYTNVFELLMEEPDEQELPVLRMRYMIDDYSEEIPEMQKQDPEPV